MALLGTVDHYNGLKAVGLSDQAARYGCAAWASSGAHQDGNLVGPVFSGYFQLPNSWLRANGYLEGPGIVGDEYLILSVATQVGSHWGLLYTAHASTSDPLRAGTLPQPQRGSPIMAVLSRVNNEISVQTNDARSGRQQANHGWATVQGFVGGWAQDHHNRSARTIANFRGIFR